MLFIAEAIEKNNTELHLLIGTQYTYVNAFWLLV